MEWKNLLSPVRIRKLLEEPSKTDVGDAGRSAIQRDLGRAVFSTPFRRLQDKAQVFPLEPIDAVRTRLTHSNEGVFD
jgi:dGTPase